MTQVGEKPDAAAPPRRLHRTTMQHEHEVLFMRSPIGMAVASLDGRLFRINPALCELLGRSLSQLMGNTLADMADPEQVARMAASDAGLLAAEVPHYELETWLQGGDGARVDAWLKVALIRGSDNAPRQLFLHVVDISARKAMERRLRHDASHDAVTGLPNRTSFALRLAEANAAGTPHGVLFVDLDGFKLINDSLGHQIGDDVLVDVGRRLLLALGDAHLLTRHGGDEFVILLLDLADEAAAFAVAEQVQAALSAPFNLMGQQVYMSASIGIALSRTRGEDGEVLVRQADMALSKAKEAGRGSVALFDDEMHTHVIDRLRLETEMRRGLERDEFETYYQPVVRLEDGKIAGFEALMRWRHPERGTLNPAAFLDAAEDTGHIIPLGRRVVEDVCRLLPQLQNGDADRPVFVTVNLGRREFSHPALADELEAALHRTQVDPRCLRLEITETVMMAYERNDFELLDRLKRMGLRLYIDDFGTGHSSLAHLHRLPIDAVKIDREFVRRCGPNGENLEIVVAVVAIASAFNIDVVAEGIENADQLSHLRRLGCHFGQGYHFGRPMNAAATLELIRNAPQW